VPAHPVLLIEDDPNVQRLIRRVLEGAGHPVVAIDRSDDLPATLDGARIAVIDIHIQPDGAQATARVLRERDPALGILFVSGAPPKVDDEAYLEQVGGAFLQKPFPPALLRQKVVELSGR
jgi:CheY-like chemotaxis protein